VNGSALSGRNVEVEDEDEVVRGVLGLVLDEVRRSELDCHAVALRSRICLRDRDL